MKWKLQWVFRFKRKDCSDLFVRLKSYAGHTKILYLSKMSFTLINSNVSDNFYNLISEMKYVDNITKQRTSLQTLLVSSLAINDQIAALNSLFVVDIAYFIDYTDFVKPLRREVLNVSWAQWRSGLLRLETWSQIVHVYAGHTLSYWISKRQTVRIPVRSINTLQCCLVCLKMFYVT